MILPYIYIYKRGIGPGALGLSGPRELLDPAPWVVPGVGGRRAPGLQAKSFRPQRRPRGFLEILKSLSMGFRVEDAIRTQFGAHFGL